MTKKIDDNEEDFSINEEWREEIKKRCNEIDEGLAQLQRKYS